MTVCEKCGKSFEKKKAYAAHVSWHSRFERGDVPFAPTEHGSAMVQLRELGAQQRTKLVQHGGVSGAASSDAHRVTVLESKIAVAPQSDTAEPAQQLAQATGDDEPPAWMVSQVDDQEAKQRMTETWKATVAARRARQEAELEEQQKQLEAAQRAAMQPTYTYQPQPQVAPGPGQISTQVAPAPNEDNPVTWIVNLAKEGYKFFRDMRAEKAAAAVIKEPSLTELLGQRALANFMDQLGREGGKAMGKQMGRYEPATTDDIGYESGLYALRLELDRKTRELADLKAKRSIIESDHIPV